MSEFRDVFGMRYVGLVDSGSLVYVGYRVPNPTAPYPQDYVIDQQGVVRYWSDQFDPWEVIATIDRLLATGIEDGPPTGGLRVMPEVLPNPSSGVVQFRGDAPVEVLDASGRLLALVRPGERWKAEAGVYFARVRGASDASPAARFVVIR